MRANGVPESHVTGDAPPREKFRAWARTVPKLLGNPLYHWTHLELKRFFGIDTLLNPDTETEIWDATSDQLADLPCREMMRRMDVRVVCTTDDPADSLAFHETIAADPSCTVHVYPTFRPDAALRVEYPAEFNAWLQQLSAAANVDIDTFDDFWTALAKRHDDFHRVGCRLSAMRRRAGYNSSTSALCATTACNSAIALGVTPARTPSAMNPSRVP
jgi:glucuronate isomerase